MIKPVSQSSAYVNFINHKSRLHLYHALVLTELFQLRSVREVPLKPHLSWSVYKDKSPVCCWLPVVWLYSRFRPLISLPLPGSLGYTDRIRTGRLLSRLEAQESARNLTPAACREMFLLMLSPLHYPDVPAEIGRENKGSAERRERALKLYLAIFLKTNTKEYVLMCIYDTVKEFSLFFLVYYIAITQVVNFPVK